MGKKTILILHGWKVPVERYRSVKNLLEKKGFDVYVPVLPGFGKKEELKKPLTLDDYVEFVASYMKKNNIVKSTIVGHSFGGRVAIKLACCYPQLAKNLILTGTPGLLPVSKIRVKFFLILAKIGNFIFALPLLSNYSNLGRKILYHLASTSDYLHTKGKMRETFKSIIGQDLTSFIKKVNLPVILVWGKLDKHVPLKVAKALEKLFSSAQLVIVKRAGHDLPYRQPVTFVNRIEKYL